MKFQTIRIEGNTISADILEKISEGEYRGQLPKDFGLEPGVKVKDEIARAWADAQNQWKIFKSRTSNLDDDDTGLPEVRKYWMVPFLGLLDYNIETGAAEKLDNGNSYPISHRETKLDRFPVYIVGYKDKEQNAPEERSTLDIKPSNASRKMSPHALVQEYVNLTEYAYAIITNGFQIRLLRDSSRLVKLSFLEFDLQQMMEEEAFADFALLFRVLHASRLPHSRQETAESLIEQYHQDSIESGARIREGLSEAVEKSIRSFANGFLKHPGNQALRNAIIKKDITPEKYYQYQLRLIYRLLFLMVTEERNLIYGDQHTKKLRDIYYQHYSVERLRRMVDKRFLADSRYSDHWEGLKHTFQLFEKERYGGALAIKPLNGELFGINALGTLHDCALDNQVLLGCIRNLTVFVNKNTHQMTRVNYASLNVEEFGSVYEGLLEYDPVLNITDAETISFDFKTGEARSSSGSHYTPEELVQPLIKHSLEHIIKDKLKEKNKEEGLLSIKICDVACGSGHILLSAARRIATEVARVRTKEDQPTPGALRLAIRDVIKSCIYGVDKNPLAVELCKVALWLESHNPGEPLGFLDHHIKCGDAIMGLAHREELEKGIADEAFKTFSDDDKEIANAYSKQNKGERKERENTGTQLKAEFETSVQGNVQEALSEYGFFLKLPERTPEDVEGKQRAYQKFLNGKGYTFLKTMADTQVAQFFIPKTIANKDRLVTDAEFRQILRGYKSWQSPKTSFAETVSQEQRFFHWFIEFPEIFQHGGFDCVLGNPPYLGGSKISSNYGNRYSHTLLSWYSDSKGMSDLVSYFLKRDFEIIRKMGFVALITTDSVSQGATREAGLDYLIANSGSLIFAIKSIEWPGEAGVTVSLFTIHKGNWNGDQFLGRLNVSQISSYFTEDIPDNHPFTIHANESVIYTGTKIYGDGFVLDVAQRDELIKKDPRNASVIFPYLSGDDLTNSPELKSDRYVINFFDWPLNAENDRQRKSPQGAPYAEDFPDCLTIIERLVKSERLKLDDKAARDNWWLYQRARNEMYSAIQNRARVLVIPQTAKYPLPVFVDNGQIYSVKVVVFVNSDLLNFGVLTSCLHQEWIRKFGTTMGTSRLQYSTSECFENFPIPVLINPNVIEDIASKLENLRTVISSTLHIGLTKTYNLLHLKYLTSVDIEKQSKQSRNVCEKAHLDILKLRELHVQIDNAVLEAYGWPDIHLLHDFQEVDYLPENDRIRYTIHPEARKEILKRLLALNHKIHEEEVKAGLWDKKKPEKAKKELKKSIIINQESLFSKNLTPMLEFDLNTGIYSVRDVASITGFTDDKIKRWFKDLAIANYEGINGDGQTDIGKLKISFHGLIELVVIGTLRENNFSLDKILKARADLRTKTLKVYPFATNNVRDDLKVSGKSIIFKLADGSIITLDGKGQYLLDVIKQFFKDIEFDTNGVAQKLLPKKGKGKIAIDPKVGDGKPSVKDKGVWAETIASIYTGPESLQLIKEQYDLEEDEILAAIEYCN
ncbi:MAG: DNA methyltransferase [Bacteroidota bacterium]